MPRLERIYGIIEGLLRGGYVDRLNSRSARGETPAEFRASKVASVSPGFGVVPLATPHRYNRPSPLPAWMSCLTRPTPYPFNLASHRAIGYGRPWAGTPQDFADLAEQVQRIARSATGETKDCWISVTFENQRQTMYDSVNDFVAGILPVDVSHVRSAMIGYTGTALSVTANVRRSSFPALDPPFIRAEGTERAAVEGVSRLVTDLFSGPRIVRQGLRRPGERSSLDRWRARAGWLVAIAITAVITASVTLGVNRILSPHTGTPPPTTTSSPATSP